MKVNGRKYLVVNPRPNAMILLPMFTVDEVIAKRNFYEKDTTQAVSDPASQG